MMSPASFIANGFAGDIALAEAIVSGDARPFEMLAEKGAPFLLPATALAREDYAHLDVRRSFQALGYVPIIRDDYLVGAIEIVSYGPSLTEDSLQSIEPIASAATIALDRASQYEQERNNHLESIHRLTQLYDLEKVLNSTLELDELLHLIPEKVRDILQARAVNLWLFDGEELTLKGQAGLDPTVALGAIQSAGAGYIGDIAETGEPSVIGADDPRLELRNGELATRRRRTGRAGIRNPLRCRRPPPR